ncbi:hypothetical protein D3C72_1700810 [compost metagenome]
MQNLQLRFVDLQARPVNSGTVIRHLRPEHPQLALLFEQTLFVDEPLMQQIAQLFDFTTVGFLQANLGSNHRLQSLDLLIQLANALAQHRYLAQPRTLPSVENLSLALARFLSSQAGEIGDLPKANHRERVALGDKPCLHGTGRNQLASGHLVLEA